MANVLIKFFGVIRKFLAAFVFPIFQMVSAGPSRLTAEQCCQRVCDDNDFEESVSDIEVQVIICNFARCLGSTFFVIVVTESPLSDIL